MAEGTAHKPVLSWLSRRFEIYAILGCLLPILGFSIWGPLPFVHYTDFDGRLLGAGAVGLVLLVFEFKKVPNARRLSQLFRGMMLTFGTGVIVFISAHNSATIFGALSHVLPSTAYQETTQVERAWFKQYRGKSSKRDTPPRHEWVQLELRSKESGKLLYLDLPTSILQEHYPITTATIHLTGWKTLLGPYVTHATYDFHNEYDRPSK